MIIYYNKNTGLIKGMIEGRRHSEQDLKVKIGKDGDLDKIVINWIKSDSGSYVPEVSEEDQIEIILKLDKKPHIVYDFKIDIASKKLVEKQ
jgi:hypothetical protein